MTYSYNCRMNCVDFKNVDEAILLLEFIKLFNSNQTENPNEFKNNIDKLIRDLKDSTVKEIMSVNFSINKNELVDGIIYMKDGSEWFFFVSDEKYEVDCVRGNKR